MQGYKPKDTRITVVVSHSGAGKTSLIEAVLHKTGITSRLGRIDDNTSVCDYNVEEKERKITIYAKVLHCTDSGKSIFLMDTPGYADFFGEVISSLRVVDSAVLVIDGISGVQVGTQRVWKKIVEQKLPLIIFVNKLDKENSDFFKALDTVRSSIGKMCVPIQVPNGREGGFKGMLDILGIPSGLPAEAEKYRNMLVESIAETDDALLEKYLDAGSLSNEELSGALKKAVLENKIIPVLGGAAVKELGVSEFLKAIEKYLPSSVERVGDDSAYKPSLDAPYSAFVFKVVTDPYVGQLTFFRVYSGVIKSDSQIYNITKNVKEKTGQLILPLGKEQISVAEAGPGDIIAATKLKDTAVNDIFSPQSNPVKFAPIVFPKPSVSFAVQPRSKGDEEKIGKGLQRLSEEDHTFEVYRDRETKELVVSGMGELHLDIMLGKLKSKFGVEVSKSAPKIAYKETITSKGSSQYRHKKQSGGAGQFAEVWMRVEPVGRGKGFEFVNEVVGGAIPAQFVASCEKGVKAALASGILAGFPVIDVRAIVYDGKTHPVDSKDIAFQIAARNAFKEACQKAKPALLEPIMNVEVSVPVEFMGDVTGDLNGKRGRIMGMDQIGDLQVIKAQVPISEMTRYSADMRSLTGGRGSFTMEFSHYEPVPARFAQDIIAKAQKAKEEK